MGRSGVDVAFGKRATIGSMRISCLSNEAEATRSATTCFLTLWTSGGAEIEFEYIAKVPPFDELRFRQQLLERLNAIGSFSIAEEHELRNRPNISYRALSDPAPLQAFLDVQEWLVETFASSAAIVAE